VIASGVHRYGRALALAVSIAAMVSALWLLSRPAPPPPPLPWAPERLRVGVNADLTSYDEAALSAALSRLAQLGLTTVRQPFDWGQIEPAAGQFTWDAYDRIVAAFGRFAARLAARYAGKIHLYQVWDEPNIAPHWGARWVDPTAYAGLLREGYAQIKAADPDSVVLTASLAPTLETGGANLSDIAFLEQLLAAGPAAGLTRWLSRPTVSIRRLRTRQPWLGSTTAAPSCCTMFCCATACPTGPCGLWPAVGMLCLLARLTHLRRGLR
jgi:hypothetical protein